MSSSRQQTICIAAPHYLKNNIGGAEVQNYILAKELIRLGWKVHYISGDIDQNEVDEEIHLHPFTQKTSFSGNCLELEKIMQTIRPDVVYQRGRSLWTAMVGRYAKMNRVPFLFALSMDIDCRKFRNLSRVFETGSRNVGRIVWNMLREGKMDLRSLQGMRQASRILCQTDYQQHMLRKRLHCRSTVFRNMHPVPTGPAEDSGKENIVLWLASVKKWKQPEIFLRLAQEFSSSGWTFILAGRLADKAYQPLLAKAQQSITGFRFIEDVDFDRSNALLAKASLFVNTSLKNEGFPNTFIQAWLRQVPTITLYFDPDDLIKKHDIGLHSSNYEQLIMDVGGLIKDTERRRAMGKRAREWAACEFGIENRFPDFVNIVETCMESA